MKTYNEFKTDIQSTQLSEGFMDTMKQLVPGAKGKSRKNAKKSDNAEQTKIAAEIDRKLKLIDGLMQKVRPLGGNLGKLMAFRRLPLSKMSPKGMYIALNDWYHSVEDELDYGDDSVALQKKYQRSVEDLYGLWEEVGFKLSDYMWASGYNIKGIGQMAKIGFSAKKRTDPEWLKMNESVDEGFGDNPAIEKAKESNNKKLSPTKFLQPIIKRFPKHEDELRKHISTHVELDSPIGYAKLRKDINATLDKIAK